MPLTTYGIQSGANKIIKDYGKGDDRLHPNNGWGGDTSMNIADRTPVTRVRSADLVCLGQQIRKIHIVSSALPFTVPNTHEYNVTEQNGAYTIKVPNGSLFFAPNFFGPKLSNRCLEYFQENDTLDWKTASWKHIDAEDFQRIRFAHMQWTQDYINIQGRNIPLPRKTAWYGDDGLDYTYSGITSHPIPWNPGLLHLRESIQRATNHHFNSVLLNWYRNGSDSIGWHGDDEPELGRNPTIGSANFGTTRSFLLRRNSRQDEVITIPLQHGSLLIMSGALQHHWKHSVPKEHHVKGSRFNLTFRTIHPNK